MLKLKYLIISLLFIVANLYATPNIAEIKAAVKANPTLLNTPEAKAAMAQEGLSVSDVKAKLDSTKNSSTSSSVSNSETVKNNIDLTTETQILKSQPTFRVNPFAYQSSGAISKALSEKQQRLVENKLVRYSNKFFANRNVINSASVPTPNNYIISNGDTLVIYIYGDRDQTFTLTVNNDGNIELPYVGPISIGGMKFIDAKRHLLENLKNHFKLSDFYINMKKYSTIQVTLVGDVKAPGLYNLASFSTIKDLLLAAKGLNTTASVRNLEIKRNGKIIKNIDFYDLLFKANSVNSVVLKQGDIVVVHKAHILASVDGYVNSAAIFELKKGQTVSDMINYAGGMKPDASKANIKLKRYLNNDKIKTYKLTYNQAKHFKVQNGDKVYIYPLDFASVESVNIYGNVIRPGSYNLPKEKTLNALFRKNLRQGIKQFFLPETYFGYAVLKRYAKNLNYETLSFNLMDVIQNKKIIKLRPQDKIYIFAQSDIFSSAYVTTKGSNLVQAGKLQYYNGITIKDAINASKIKGVIDDKVRVTTFATKDYMPKTTFYSLKKQGNVTLNPYDEIEVFGYYDTHILAPIAIYGEVIHPLNSYYERGMSVQKLINMAGGLTPKSYTEEIEIIRYYVDKSQTRRRKILHINMREKKFSDLKLEPYDEVRIFTIPKWGERKVVTLNGQVRFPGKYTIETGEKLSSVIERAGGFTKEAFLDGAVFTRESIRQNQLRQYNQTLARIKRQLAIFNAMPANAKQTMNGNNLSTLNEVMAESKRYQPIGRISIKLDENLTKFEKEPYNLVLENNDVLTIPSQKDTVTVFGEVFNATSFVYNDKLNAEDYINLASGYARGADKDSVYVIHADGTSEPIESGWLSSSVKIHKGDTIVVPMYIKEYSQLSLWESVSKIMASFAITAATLNTLGVF